MDAQTTAMLPGDWMKQHEDVQGAWKGGPVVRRFAISVPILAMFACAVTFPGDGQVAGGNSPPIFQRQETTTLAGIHRPPQLLRSVEGPTASRDHGRFATQVRYAGRPTLLRGERADGSEFSLEVRTEVISDPEKSVVFNQYSGIAITSQGGQYYLDRGDKNVKRFSSELQLISVFSGPGQGPGELEDPWLITLSPSGGVLVFDRARDAFAVFDADGIFVEQLPLPVELTGMQISRVAHPTEDLLVVCGLALSPDIFGYALHLVAVERKPPGRALRYLRSFAETPLYDPAVYLRAATGEMAIDLDGGILYSQRNPYDIRKYLVDGTLVWQLQDPDGLPPVTEFFEVTSSGRIRVGPFPHSYRFLPLNETEYLHVLMFEDPEGTPESPGIGVRYEVFPRKEVSSATRVRVEGSHKIAYTGADVRGRVYGFLVDNPITLVRSSFHIRTGVAGDGE